MGASPMVAIGCWWTATAMLYRPGAAWGWVICGCVFPALKSRPVACSPTTRCCATRTIAPSGHEYFDYVWESTGNYMANSLYSDYNGPNEKSWQLRYDLDLASFGVPGLTTSLWHAKGWDIDGTHYSGDRNGRNTGYNVRGLDNAKHDENGLMVAYVVQSGALKNAVFRTIVYNHRATGGQIDGSYDEFRLVANLPLRIF